MYPVENSIPRIRLPGTPVTVSRFVFGTASLFNVGGQKRRLALLSAALDAGFTHFDTAPYYGFGWAERDLGMLQKARGGFTVTSKVGIYSPGGEDASHLSVFLRKAGGRLLPSLSRPEVDFSLNRARVALTASLRRLERDCIDIYMLHEPELALVAAEEWRRWLEDEVSRGRIGAWGLALPADRLAPFLDASPELTGLVQVLDSLDGREADLLTDRGRPLQITYGYVSAERVSGGIRPVEQILGDALLRNAHGAIIVSTTKADRLGQYRRLLETGV